MTHKWYLDFLIPNINNIVVISAGYDYSLLLNSNGEVYSFGRNYYVQLVLL